MVPVRTRKRGEVAAVIVAGGHGTRGRRSHKMKQRTGVLSGERRGRGVLSGDRSGGGSHRGEWRGRSILSGTRRKAVAANSNLSGRERKLRSSC